MGLDVIYLLHFDRPLSGHALHYMGWTPDLWSRMRVHASGGGSCLMRAVYAEGITFQLARTWVGGRSEERRLKARPIGSRGLRRYCPVCHSMPRVNRWAGGGKVISRRIIEYQQRASLKAAA